MHKATSVSFGRFSKSTALPISHGGGPLKQMTFALLRIWRQEKVFLCPRFSGVLEPNRGQHGARSAGHPHLTFCFWLQRYEKTRVITHRPQWNTDLMSIFSHACHAKCISAFFRVKSVFSLTPATRKWCLCFGHMVKIEVLPHFRHAPASVSAISTHLLL